MKENLIKGSEIVCKALINEGVDTVFGIPEEQYYHFMGTLNKFPEISIFLLGTNRVHVMQQMVILEQLEE